MTASGESSSLEIASIFFGVFIGLFFFTVTNVARQTWRIMRRIRTIANWYLFMIWVEAIVNMVFALTTYLFIRGNIKPSLGYYIGAVSLWMLQTQLLLQIIANRVGLILVDKRKTRILQWSIFAAIALVNISVYCVWIPAELDVDQAYVAFNHIWERIEKSIFLSVDLGLNIYFLYLVRSQLIAKGLTKYWRLFYFNAYIVILSVTMDCLLLGLLSLPNAFDYVQFAPVAYTVKLNIELTMAVFISKVVCRAPRVDNQSSSFTTGDDRSHLRTVSDGTFTTRPTQAYFSRRSLESLPTFVEKTERVSSMTHHEEIESKSIVKTVTVCITEDEE